MVTNNVRCLEKWEGKLKVDYKEEWSYLDVLLRRLRRTMTGIFRMHRIN